MGPLGDDGDTAGHDSGEPTDEAATIATDSTAATRTSAGKQLDATPPTMVDGARRDQASSFPRGTCIGRYVLLERLGSGGMGVVFEAYDPDLDRRIAIKLLRVRARSRLERARARLLREAQALAQLSHPNVVSVHDVGTFEGRVFIAMELVGGQTLRDWLKERKRSRREIVDVFVGAGRGLAAAHAAGLVHRDFKPANAIVGADGRVRVLDFGIARASEPADSDDDFESSPRDLETADSGVHALHTPLTEAGAIVGTPRYMAPEQHRGLRTDEHSDQFSFCVALYEALYGSRPFAGESAAELRASTTAGRVQAPPAGSNVPSRLRRLLLRGLSTAPADRYESMDELLSELRTDPAAARRRVAAGLGVVALAAVTVFSVAHSTRSSKDSCQIPAPTLDRLWNEGRADEVLGAFRATGRSHADATAAKVGERLEAYSSAWRQMRDEACRATRDNGEQSERMLDLRMSCLDRRLAELDALATLFATEADPALVDNAASAASSLTSLRACADTEALDAAIPPPENPKLRAEVEELRAIVARVSALSWAAKFEPALALARSVDDQASKLDYAPIRAEAKLELGQLLDSAGDSKAAEPVLREALRLAAEAGLDELVATGLIDLAWVIGYRGTRLDEAVVLAEMADLALLRAGDVPRLRAVLLSRLATLEEGRGDYDKAAEYQQDAIELKTNALGDEHLAIGTALNNMAEIRKAQGKLVEAKELYERSIEALKQELGEDHPNVGTAMSNFGGILWDIGDYERAQQMLFAGLAIEKATFGEKHHRIATTLTSIGGMFANQNKYDEARPYLDRAIEIQQEVLEPNHPELAMALHNRGTLAQGHGDNEGAQVYFKRALAMFETILGPDHPHVAFPLLGLANTVAAQGQLDVALEHYQRAIAIQEEALGRDHIDLGWSLTSLGQCYLEMKRPADAVEPLTRAVAIRESQPGDPTQLADSQLSLAEALWGGGRDRRRAVELAKAARAAFAAAPAEYKEDVDTADQWLAAHR